MVMAGGGDEEGGLWEVVARGRSGRGGALVRVDKDLDSAEAGRLSHGAVVAELQRCGERLRFTKIAGDGPRDGWVSLKAGGAPLLLRAGEAGTALAEEAASKAAALRALGGEAGATRSVWLLSQGTRGDVQPLVVLGQQLRRRGIRSKVFASRNFRGFVESYALGFVAHGVDIQASMQAESQEDGEKESNKEKWQKKMTENKDSVAGDMIAAIMTDEAYVEMARVFADELKAERPDAIVFANLFGGLPLYAWRKYGTPCLHANYFPTWLIPEEGLRGMHEDWVRIDRIVEATTGVASVAAASYDDWRSWFLSPKGCMTAHSAELLTLLEDDNDELQERARACCDLFTGFWVIDDALQMTDLEQFGGMEGLRMMQRFLDAGPPPMYIGWGSMPIDAAILTKAVFQVKQAGQRAIVVGGWMGAGLLGLEEFIWDKLPEDPFGIIKFARKNILFVKSAPHGWLFQRCVCTVHHGGAGTTAAALLAGVPTIVTPFSFDQQYHADWVVALGCGVQLSLMKPGLMDAEWAAAFKKVCTDEQMRARARDVAARLKAEPGVSEAVARVEAALEDRRATESSDLEGVGEGPPRGRTLGF